MVWTEYCKSLKTVVSNFYQRLQHKKLNLENPKTFTEKIQWLKIYDSTMLKTFCADKITVREYVQRKLGKDICIPILHVYNNLNEINLSDLPDSFVLKCNHGSAMNIVVKDKTKFNLSAAKQKLKQWLAYDYSSIGGEAHYKLIPRKAFAEKYVANLNDTKLFCFNGKVKFIQVDRHIEEHRMNYYDTDWNPLTWLNRKCYPANYNIKDQKPALLNEMITIAEKLSADFKFVRIDLYEIDGKVYLGEMTFTPASGTQKLSYETDLKIGEMLQL